MDDLMARTIVENLSLGINPLTGESLGAEDSCSNEMVREALCVVLEHCSLDSYATEAKKRIRKTSKKKRQVVSRAKNEDGWTTKEDYRLIELCKEGKCILEIAREMRCSTDKICTKLKSLQERKL